MSQIRSCHFKTANTGSAIVHKLKQHQQLLSSSPRAHARSFISIGSRLLTVWEWVVAFNCSHEGRLIIFLSIILLLRKIFLVWIHVCFFFLSPFICGTLPGYPSMNTANNDNRICTLGLRTCTVRGGRGLWGRRPGGGEGGA